MGKSLILIRVLEDFKILKLPIYNDEKYKMLLVLKYSRRD